MGVDRGGASLAGAFGGVIVGWRFAGSPDTKTEPPRCAGLWCLQAARAVGGQA